MAGRNRDKDGKYSKHVPDEILIGLYNIGLSYEQISILVKMHSTSIIKRFEKIGFPSRSKSVARKIRYSDEDFDLYFRNKNVEDILREYHA